MGNPFSDSFEDALEQGISTTKKAVGNQVKQTTQGVISQVTGQNSSQSTPQSDTHAAQPPTGEEILEGGQAQQNQQQQTPQDPVMDTAQINQLEKQKEAEATQKLHAARQKLHSQYFQKLTTPTQQPSKQEELQQEEKKEEQEKMIKLEEQRKKDEPIALSRAKRSTEMNRGASG